MIDPRRRSKDELDRLFSALSDSTRRAMLRRLAEGPAAVGELGEPFPISKQAVSRHVGVLERAGLVARTVEGRVRRCHLVSRPLVEAEEWILELRRAWGSSLDRLERHLMEGGGWNDTSS